MIIDSYRVRDDRTGEFVPPERWEGARSDIEAALQGELDTGGRVAARAAAYRPKSAMQTPPRVEGSIDTATGDLVVTIKCSDRIGRLAEILVALHECDLEIALAKLDSRGEELVDSFHVRGQGVLDTAGIDRLAGRIAESIIP
jgi:[protein-PII] uridylyltransferase